MRISRASSRTSIPRTAQPLSLKGFTIVELLIVIVVIAILAAITIVAYNGIQTRARASQASTALAQAKKKLEMYKVDNSGYPTSANLSAAGITDNDTTYQYTSDGATYCLTATAATVSYYLNSTTQATPTAGGCAGHGQGGVAAITNLATNPRTTLLYTSAGAYPAGVAQVGHSNWCGSSDTCTKQLISGAGDGPLGIQTYLRLTWTAVVNTPQAVGYRFTGDTTGSVPVVPGDTYTASFYFRASKGWTVGINASADRFVLSFIFYDSAGVQVGASTDLKAVNQIVANTWVRPTGTATVPAGAAYMRITNGDVYVPSAVGWAVGDTFDATGLMLTKGSTLYNYADGNSANWIWNGTPNASTSTGPAV